MDSAGLLSQLSFNGSPVVVTGAGAGIGAACARVMADLGAAIVAVDLDEQALTRLREDLAGSDHAVETFVADASDEDAVEAVRGAVESRGDGLACLVNVAGINDYGQVADLSLERWERILRINLTSTFLMSRGFLGLLKASEGSIVNISSTYGLIGNPNTPAYCASKAGIVNLTRQMAIDLAPHRVRVNVVCPGPTLTPRRQRSFDEGRSDRAAAEARTLSKRLARPEEIANAVAFLGSRAASYINAAVLAVDDGQTAHTGLLE